MSEPPSKTAIVVLDPSRLPDSYQGSPVLPRLIAEAGDKAARRFLEFFAATISNDNTRMAYLRACRRFLDWCDARPEIEALVEIEPLHVAAYVKAMGRDFEKPTVKQHLAAVRMLFDWLVTGQIVAINPAHAVRGPKHVTKRGKTPVLTTDEARKLLEASMSRRSSACATAR